MILPRKSVRGFVKERPENVKCKRGQELIIDTINTAFGTPFKRHYVQIKQNFGEKWAYPNGV